MSCRGDTRGRGRRENKVTMCHPSVSALLTLAMVDLPGSETLTATVQSAADSLQERTRAREWCAEPGCTCKLDLGLLLVNFTEQCVPTLCQMHMGIPCPRPKSSWPQGLPTANTSHSCSAGERGLGNITTLWEKGVWAGRKYLTCYLFFFQDFIYLLMRERESMGGRDGEEQSEKQTSR